MLKVMDFATYKKLHKLSLNDTNRWIKSVYASAYDEGQKDMMSECVASLTEDMLLDILLSVKGIGEKRARQVIDKILTEGIAYGSEIGRDNEKCEQKI